LEPVESATAARLRCVSDREPGLCRVRAGRGFAYRTAQRTLLRLLEKPLDHQRSA
jgi:hypothetical protein